MGEEAARGACRNRRREEKRRKEERIAEAEEDLSDAFERCANLEDSILRWFPTSPAGAAARLQLSRNIVDQDRDGGLDLSLAAIERVADFFERRQAA